MPEDPCVTSIKYILLAKVRHEINMCKNENTKNTRHVQKINYYNIIASKRDFLIVTYMLNKSDRDPYVGCMWEKNDPTRSTCQSKKTPGMTTFSSPVVFYLIMLVTYSLHVACMHWPGTTISYNIYTMVSNISYKL